MMKITDSSPSSGDNQHGMTLLEIMLALLILSTVVTMVSISLSGSLNVLNATQQQGEIYHRAQVALQRISEDLASAVLVEDVDFIGSAEQLDGEDADTLQFTSTAHVVFNRQQDNPGIAVLSYKVEEDPGSQGGLVLIRSDELLATSAVTNGGQDAEGGFLLCDGLRSVQFRYFDESGEETDTWSTSEDALSSQDERKLPVAVSCTLEFWLDRENDSSIEFSTGVLLPVGLINAQSLRQNATP
ncbi:MAG: GspJ family type II secretion system protein [Desulfobulbaceae bacterium]|nr:GspJ family type II secretion system protein [Desulfobulbaceae bacterium]